MLWGLLVWKKYREYSTPLQRGLLMVPVLKLIQVFLYGIYVGDCPWMNQLKARYLMMGLFTVSTIHQTVFIAFLLLLSKGWKIARQHLTRGDMSTFTLLMGAVYLTYSAYYVSVNIPGMRLFVGVRCIID